MKFLVPFRSRIAEIVAAGVVLAASGAALAQTSGGGSTAPYTPATMPDIELPIDMASLVTKVVLVAVGVLTLTTAVWIGWKMFKSGRGALGKSVKA